VSLPDALRESFGKRHARNVTKFRDLSGFPLTLLQLPHRVAMFVQLTIA